MISDQKTADLSSKLFPRKINLFSAVLILSVSFSSSQPFEVKLLSDKFCLFAKSKYLLGITSFWIENLTLIYDFGNETVFFEHLRNVLGSLHAQPVVAKVEPSHGRVCHESGRDGSYARTAQAMVAHGERLIVDVAEKVRGRYYILLLAVLQVDALAAEIFRLLFYYQGL